MKAKRERILVIGAGASGMMAAALLASHHDVIVLEARDRTGGRISPVEEKFDFPAEAGAEFIHGTQPLTEELLAQKEINTLPFEGIHYRKESGRTFQDSNIFSDQWHELVESLGKLQTDEPISEFLRANFSGRKYDELRKTVKQFAEGYDAADVTRVSAFALREEWTRQDDDEQFRIKGGYLQVIRHLEEQVKRKGGGIILSAEVSKISWSPGTVRTITKDGRAFVGERVLVTVPLGVLQHKTIAFSPKLTKHETAILKLGVGGVIKFLFQFTPTFWQRIVKTKFPDFGFIFSDAEIPTWWSQTPTESPIITGWLAGPCADSIDKDPQFLFGAAVRSLCYLFDVPRETLTSAVTCWHIADWVSDPFARGAYAYATVGSQEVIEFLVTPIDDTLYFAGEALYTGIAMGTVEAALRSGQDAALRILS